MSKMMILIPILLMVGVFVGGYGGFSHSFPLNHFFSVFYDTDTHRRDVFFIEGAKNPSDGPSRSTRIREGLSACEAAIIFHDLS